MTTTGQFYIFISVFLYFIILGYISYGLFFGQYYRMKGGKSWVTRDIVYGIKARLKSVVNIALMLIISCVPFALMDNGSGFSGSLLKENLRLIFQQIPKEQIYALPLLIGSIMGLALHRRFIKNFLLNPRKSTWDINVEVAKKNLLNKKSEI